VVNRYLTQRPGFSRREIYRRIGTIYNHLRNRTVPVVHKGLWRILERVEREEASKRGLEEFKYGTNDEMLRRIEENIVRRP
jgi:hypothetical protein